MIIYAWFILALLSVVTIVHGIKGNGEKFLSGIIEAAFYVPIIGRVLGWW